MTQGGSGLDDEWLQPDSANPFSATSPETGYPQPAYGQSPPMASQLAPYTEPGARTPSYVQPDRGGPTTYGQPTAYGQPTSYGQPTAYGQATAYGRPAGYPQPGYQQAGYPPPGVPPQGFGPLTPKAPAIAVVGLILAFMMPIVGLIVSIIALAKTRRAGAGRGLAIGGVVVGGLLTLLAGLLIAGVWSVVTDVNDARNAYEDMSTALRTGDCDLFMENTTENFRETLLIGSCDDFDAAVDTLHSGPVPPGDVPVTNARLVDGDVIVTTVEAVVPGAGSGLLAFDYTVIERDGTWLVDDVDFAN